MKVGDKVMRMGNLTTYDVTDVEGDYVRLNFKLKWYNTKDLILFPSDSEKMIEYRDKFKDLINGL
jgi:hypothetical protein